MSKPCSPRIERQTQWRLGSHELVDFDRDDARSIVVRVRSIVGLDREALSPSPDQIIRWIRYGAGIGLIGVLLVGIICGPIAIYFGVRARTAAALTDTRLKRLPDYWTRYIRRLVLPDFIVTQPERFEG